MKASRVTRICFTLSGIKDYRISGMAEIIAGSAHGLIEQGRKFTQLSFLVLTATDTGTSK